MEMKRKRAAFYPVRRTRDLAGLKGFFGKRENFFKKNENSVATFVRVSYSNCRGFFSVGGGSGTLETSSP